MAVLAHPCTWVEQHESELESIQLQHDPDWAIFGQRIVKLVDKQWISEQLLITTTDLHHLSDSHSIKSRHSYMHLHTALIWLRNNDPFKSVLIDHEPH